MTVEDIIGEPLDVHHLYKSRAERREKILNLMEHCRTECGACDPLCA
jgi:ABC-type microcin C transport system duplicated ATPase subunit YejF